MTTSRPRIGELLLARGACTREQLREAWEQKVLYGDRLGTNLLALHAIDEHNLARALGQQHGVHSGYGRVIAPEPSAVALIPKSLAVRRFVVPHHVVDKQLFVMMRDPNDAIAIDEVAFAASMRVTPVVVCEARIWQLIERHYRAVISMRPVPLDGVVTQSPAATEDPMAAFGPELTSEEEFNRLYAGIHSGPGSSGDAARLPESPASHDEVIPPPITPFPADPDSAPPPFHAHLDDDADRTMPARPIAILAVRDPDGAEGFLAPPRTGADPDEWRDTIEKTQPMMALPRVSELGQADDTIVDLVEVASMAPALVEMQPPLVRQSTADFHVELPQLKNESPLSFADASNVLHAASDRNAIARIVLRAARTQFQRACLLAVYPDRFLGWMGIGDGLDDERMRDLVVTRAHKSVFSLVADSRSHFLGPLARLPTHGAWVKATGRKIPKSVAVFPILVRGRPVNLLYVDNGHDEYVGSDVGEVLILAQQIAKTYETLLKSS